MTSTEIEEFLDDEAAAIKLKVKPATLPQWRSRGIGPPYHKIGRSAYYRPSDIDAWIAQQRRIPRARGPPSQPTDKA